jgi:hypothetical protein
VSRLRIGPEISAWIGLSGGKKYLVPLQNAMLTRKKLPFAPIMVISTN